MVHLVHATIDFNDQPRSVADKVDDVVSIGAWRRKWKDSSRRNSFHSERSANVASLRSRRDARSERWLVWIAPGSRSDTPTPDPSPQGGGERVAPWREHTGNSHRPRQRLHHIAVPRVRRQGQHAFAVAFADLR